jgi:hypothetical protein
MIETVRPGIDYVVKNQMRGYYSAAARNARLIEELYRLQGRAEQAKAFIKELRERYRRHWTFGAELKQLGL